MVTHDNNCNDESDDSNFIRILEVTILAEEKSGVLVALLLLLLVLLRF